MRALALALCLLVFAAPVVAGPADTYVDDRSSPGRVIESLYNAIGRHEYLRAWSYFASGDVTPYAQFRDGYSETYSVTLRLGEIRSEGAAGSVHSAVPVALRAVTTDGDVTVFAGCYRLVQTQAGAQETPPFRPIEIIGGSLRQTAGPFGAAMGVCE